MEQVKELQQDGSQFPREMECPSERYVAWEVLERMMDAGASATGLPGGVLMMKQGSVQEDYRLLPIQDVVLRLANARMAADRMHNPPAILACTDAREAQSLTGDEDSRDRRYLSGTRTSDGSYVYCGGIHAAIARSLIYAQFADVICYRASTLDLSDAERFAREVRATFPNAQLGFGLSLRPCGFDWRGLDHGNLGRQLRKLGYDYYFFTQFGSTIFPVLPQGVSWALFDDRAARPNSGDLLASTRSLAYMPSFTSHSNHSTHQRMRSKVANDAAIRS